VKILQVPYCFYPDPVGGTEIYVEALATHLQQQGIEIIIAAPATTNQHYQHQTLPVKRFAVSPTPTLPELYGRGDPQAAHHFSQILDEEQPDLVHLHAFTSGVSYRLVQAAKQRQIPVIFTYHTPTVSCQRGTLLQNGVEICSGKLDRATCTRCTLQGMGIVPQAADLISHLPGVIAYPLKKLDLQGGIWTALRIGELVQGRHEAFHHLMMDADHIIAVCQWVKDVLLLNGVDETKITVLRQGLCHPIPAVIQGQQHFLEDGSAPLKLVFLGRLDPTKGIHLVLQALSQLPNLPISLDIYGISQSVAVDSYQQQLKTIITQDSRVRLLPPIGATEVVQTIAQYDLLVVPSQWLETGPMVVLEAFAAGVPVIGSGLGGIAELVQDEVNGILVEPGSVQAWVGAMERVWRDRSKIRQLRSQIVSPEDMQKVALTMVKLYQHHLSVENR
jgi:glycosyltransferase involved in cell wall biosynthesis